MAAGIYPPYWEPMSYTCDDCGATASTLIMRNYKWYCGLCIGKHDKKKPKRVTRPARRKVGGR